MPAAARAQVYTCGRNSLSAFAAAKTGHAEIATMMAKSSASMVNSTVLSPARKDRESSRSDWRVADLWSRVRLTIVRFTVIVAMTGPIRQKRAASGYELLKGDDGLATNDVAVIERSNAAASHRMEPAGAERHRRAGRRPSEWERVCQTPYNFNCSPRSASAVPNRSSELLCVRSRRASGN